MSFTFECLSPIIASVVTGPGDIASSATAWWGLRSYSTAAAGGNCIDIIRASDSSTQTFNTLANGNLDVGSIASFLTATTGKVSKLYDQTGHGFHMTQATGASQPAFTLSGIGSLPCMTFAGGQILDTGSVFTITAPFSISCVGQRTGNTSAYSDIVGGGGAGSSPQVGFANSPNTGLIYNGGSVGTASSVNDNVWHAMQGLFAASGALYIDGSNTAQTPGTASIANLSFGSGNNFLTGTIVEGGVWASDISANFAALNSNQHTYWGF